MKKIINSLKTPKTFNVMLLLMDHAECPLIVEITQLAYSKDEAYKAASKLVEHFNYKYSCQYKIDKVWQIKKKIELSRQGQPVKHYEIDITRAGEKQNWAHLKSEYDFIQAHYIYKDLNLEG